MRISDWSSDVCSSDLDELHDLGRRAGSESAQEWGRQAEANPPVLRTHDRYGNRIDVVEYHPAYHQLMSQAVRAGLHAAPWSDEIGRASCRERVCQSVYISGVDDSLKKKQKQHN